MLKPRPCIDACQWFYDCKGCGTIVKPNKGDCCVYCSYGDVPARPFKRGDPVECCAIAAVLFQLKKLA